MRPVNFYDGFQKLIKKLPPKHAKQIVQKVLELAANPEAHDVKKLLGYNDKLRADVGEYRIIFHYDDNCLFVELVGQRNDDEVYRQWARKFK